MNITEPCFDDDEIESLKDCLSSKWVTQGPMTEKFERLIAEKLQVDHALACTSCTSALHLAMMALELKPGDEVIVPAFTWVTSAFSAEYVGARVVFADIDLATFNLDPLALEAAITPRTKAIVVVHLFGLAAPMQEIMEVARRHDLRVVEDAACAIGTTYKGAPVGSIGDIGCLSFHPRKVITTGEGGMVLTNSRRLADLVASYRNHGSTGIAVDETEPQGPWTMATFDHVGFNLRMSDIQAAVGVAQCKKLDRLLTDRRESAARYSRMLSGLSDLALPSDGGDGGHTYQSYVVRVVEGGRSRRNQVMAYMADQDIQTRPGTHSVPRLGFYARQRSKNATAFSNANTAEDTTITLPIIPGMTEEQSAFIVEQLSHAVNKTRQG